MTQYLRGFALSLFIVLTIRADQPNVVIIYGDDVGYGDVGAYGSKMIPTPNIDALAAAGLMFTDGHSSAATCTPLPLLPPYRYSWFSQ